MKKHINLFHFKKVSAVTDGYIQNERSGSWNLHDLRENGRRNRRGEIMLEYGNIIDSKCGHCFLVSLKKRKNNEGVMTDVGGGNKNKTWSWGHNANYVIGCGVDNIDGIATWNVHMLTLGCKDFQLTLRPEYEPFQDIQ